MPFLLYFISIFYFSSASLLLLPALNKTAAAVKQSSTISKHGAAVCIKVCVELLWRRNTTRYFKGTTASGTLRLALTVSLTMVASMPPL